MDTVSPIVRTLWRIITLLDNEETARHQTKKLAETSETSNSEGLLRGVKAETDVRSINKNTLKDNNDSSRNAKYSPEKQQNGFIDQNRSSERERDGRNGSSKPRPNSREVTLTPKLTPAPSPPVSRERVSIMVSSSSILHTDQKGWLIDQLRGRRVWCAVSEKQFCVFENDQAHVSKQVILLSGCKVRHIEFKSADQDGRVLNGVARHFAAKPVNGVDKFQFILENVATGQKYMFGATSRTELDLWLNVLQDACSSDRNPCLLREIRTDSQTNEQVSFTRTAGKHSSRLANIPSQITSAAQDVNSSSPPAVKLSESHKEIVDDLRKTPPREHKNSDTKPTPMKAKHGDEVSVKATTISSTINDSARRSRPFFKTKSPFDTLLRLTGRSASADDARNRKRMIPRHDSMASSNGQVQPRSSNGQNLLSTPMNASQSISLQDISSAASADNQPGSPDNNPRPTSGSRDAGRNSKGFGVSLRRTASDLKNKLLGLGNTSKYAKSNSPRGIKLKDVSGVHLSGFLRLKMAYAFTKHFCVLSRGCFYAFKTDNSDETSVMSVVLQQCEVTYVAEAEGRRKSLFAFKVIQPNNQSVLLRAEEHQTLMAWMMALQAESRKVQIDDNLATEIRDMRFSPKQKLARDIIASQTEFDAQTNPSEVQTKRYSCPNIENFNINLSDSGFSETVQRLKYIERNEDFNKQNDVSLPRFTASVQTGNSDKVHDVQHPDLEPVNLKTSFTRESTDNDRTETVKLDTGERKTVPTIFQESCNDALHLEQLSRSDFLPAPTRTQSLLDVSKPRNGESPCHVFLSSTSLNTQQVQGSMGDNQRPSGSSDASAQLGSLDGPEKATSIFIPDLPDHVPSTESRSILPSEHKQNNETEELLPKSIIQSDTVCAHEPFLFHSPIHDNALREAWSVSEEFLMEVVREKLRKRQSRGTCEGQRGQSNEDVVIVNDEWNSGEKQQVFVPYAENLSVTPRMLFQPNH